MPRAPHSIPARLLEDAPDQAMVMTEDGRSFSWPHHLLEGVRETGGPVLLQIPEGFPLPEEEQERFAKLVLNAWLHER